MFECNKCLSVFSRKDILTRHLKSHEKKKFQCSVCGVLFVRDDSLKRHTEKMHGNLRKRMKTNHAKDLQIKKWCHIRDNYTKYINQEKNIPSGSGAVKRKKYHHAGILSFLKPTVEKRSTSGNFLNESTDKETGDEINLNMDDFSPDQPTPDQPTSSFQNIQNSKKNKPKMTTFQTKLINPAEEQQSIADPDKLFLLSLLPELKKLDDDKRLGFRIYAIKYFQNAYKAQPTTSLQHPVPHTNFNPGTTENSLQNMPFYPQSTALYNPYYNQ